MDGFFGGAKPRQLSWNMPVLFFVLFAALFVRVLIAYLTSLSGVAGQSNDTSISRLRYPSRYLIR
jgi:hypothetical protein